jgi:hypothetical protein
MTRFMRLAAIALSISSAHAQQQPFADEGNAIFAAFQCAALAEWAGDW